MCECVCGVCACACEDLYINARCHRARAQFTPRRFAAITLGVLGRALVSPRHRRRWFSACPLSSRETIIFRVRPDQNTPTTTLCSRKRLLYYTIILSRIRRCSTHIFVDLGFRVESFFFPVISFSFAVEPRVASLSRTIKYISYYIDNTTVSFWNQFITAALYTWRDPFPVHPSNHVHNSRDFIF